MTNNEYLILLSDLMLAVRNNNLNQVKELLPKINEVLTYSIDDFSLDLTRKNFHDNLQVIENFLNFEQPLSESYLYLIHNIKLPYGNLTQDLIWLADYQILKKEKSSSSINDFINKSLNEQLKEWQISKLIDLAITIGNFDLLENIRNIISTKEG